MQIATIEFARNVLKPPKRIRPSLIRTRRIRSLRLDDQKRVTKKEEP
jgi:hypothetical protein